jgi:hypothetical protein
MTDVVSVRALNRATLARQLLLEPSPLDPLTAVERLVGLQAQVPANPYVALWSRLATFDPEELGRHLVGRRLVRSAAIRGTLHLLTAEDCLTLWPASRPVLERELKTHRDFGPKLDGVDLGEPLAWARSFLDRPRSLPELKDGLRSAFPSLDPAALSLACRNRLALVQVPPRGLWGRSHQVTVTTLEAWVGRPLEPPLPMRDLVLRYLAAFGPATAADISTWSRLTGVGPVVDELRPHLHVLHDERGRVLVDLPDAPRPDEATPAPVRFLPEYDNLLLSHADRTRFVSGDVSPLYPPGRLGRGHVLVDGTVQATWVVDGDAITVRHLGLPEEALEEVSAVGERLASLLDMADHRPRFEDAGQRGARARGRR